MNDIKTFCCGKCDYLGTRMSLRNHLKQEHFIRKEITNSTIGGRYDKGSIAKTYRQTWWSLK